MNLTDLFFSTPALTGTPRALGRECRKSARQARARSGRNRERIDDLEEDVQTLALILGGVMRRLDEQGTLTREDMRASIAALDGVDGSTDGKLGLNVLKEMTE
jgi:hypothetical protein